MAVVPRAHIYRVNAGIVQKLLRAFVHASSECPAEFLRRRNVYVVSSGQLPGKRSQSFHVQTGDLTGSDHADRLHAFHCDNASRKGKGAIP